MKKLQNIKKDFVSHGKTLKGLEEQVVFSSVFLLDGWDEERRRSIGQVNYWLRVWCQDQGSVYYDLGQAFERPGMWVSDGNQLSRWGKSILGSKLVGLVTRSLNYIKWEKGMEFLVTEEGQVMLSF